jgi:hypothetical protein
MDYILLQRVLNIIKLQLWHKSKLRICIRGYMVCCDKCNKAYMSDFDGYLCLRIFFKKKGYNCSRDIVPNLDSLTFSYDLKEFELNIVIDVLSKFYTVDLSKGKHILTIKNKN